MNRGLSMDQVLIEKLTNILEDNLDKDYFGVKELARKVGLSRSQLHRKLKSVEGKSTSRFIREFRLQKAMELLQNNVATSSEIAYRVGFGSPTYFNTCFHDYYGYPPGEVKFRNPAVNKDIEEIKIAESIETSLNKHKTKPLKKHFFGKKMVWVYTIWMGLLTVFSFYLYKNYRGSSSSEIINKDNLEKSIAMLPFKNLSTNVENQYFVDGMMDDVLNHLSGIQGLVVKSTQSSEQYRESEKTTTQIGKELNVNYLLEGSVQNHADSLRIIIQLIDAVNDTHLWSDNYDFELKQVFNIQSDISKQIAKELNMVISPVELKQLNKKPTENIEAYNMYLKGRFFWHRRTEEDLIKSINYFEQALKIDSTYALAYAGLADSYFIMGFWRWIPREEGFKKGKKFAEMALSMDNTIAEAHTTLGSIYLYQDRNFEASEKQFKKALSLNPNYATGHHFYSDLLGALGKRKEAIEQIRLALQLNPNSYMMNYNGALHCFWEERFEEALKFAKRAKEIDEKQQRNLLLLFAIYIQLGNYDLAAVEMEEFYRLDPNTAEVSKGVREAFNKGGIEGLYRYMIEVDFESGYAEKNPSSQALQYTFINDTENAFLWLEKETNGDAAKIINIIDSDFRLKKLQNSLQYNLLLKEINDQTIKN